MIALKKTLCLFLRSNGRRYFYTRSVKLIDFKENDNSRYEDEPPELTWNYLKDTASTFWSQCKVMKDEIKIFLRADPLFELRHDEIIKVFTFSDEEMKRWIVSSDSDNGDGYSRSTFKRTPNGTVLFSGNLNTDIPKDGKMLRTGYCNIRSPLRYKSFYRETYYDWSTYTHLVLKVRGDGRSYLINLSTKGFYDISWHDMFSYALYTRGGPYWQLTKIPFSKFFFSSKGRVQDKQPPCPLTRIYNLGITVCDQTDGPFQLEIEYIGLDYSMAHEEESAYETYITDKWIADT